MESAWFRRWQFIAALILLASLDSASASGHDSKIRPCLKSCAKSGCAGNSCLPSCRYLNSTVTYDGVVEKLGVLDVNHRSKEWICSMECRYHCLLSKETEEAGLDQEAIGYHGSWCLARVMVHQQSSKDLYLHLAKSALTSGLNLRLINEPASAVLSALNVVASLLGLLTFIKLVHYNLPLRPISRGPYYPFAGLSTIYGILSTIYWLARCVYHSRNMVFDKHIESTLEVVLAGYAVLLALVRVGNMRTEQARVVAIAPTLAFLVPHIMFFNLCSYGFGLNMQVCLVLGTIQHLLWVTWAGVTKHPARFQLWFIALIALLSVFLRIYDFSYLSEVLDTESLWIASATLSTIMWWSFVRTDAAFVTQSILKKRDAQNIHEVEPKKVR